MKSNIWTFVRVKQCSWTFGVLSCDELWFSQSVEPGVSCLIELIWELAAENYLLKCRIIGSSTYFPIFDDQLFQNMISRKMIPKRFQHKCSTFWTEFYQVETFNLIFICDNSCPREIYKWQSKIWDFLDLQSISPKHEGKLPNLMIFLLPTAANWDHLFFSNFTQSKGREK